MSGEGNIEEKGKRVYDLLFLLCVKQKSKIIYFYKKSFSIWYIMDCQYFV